VLKSASTETLGLDTEKEQGLQCQNSRLIAEWWPKIVTLILCVALGHTAQSC